MKTHNVVVGIFVTAAIVLFAACLFLIGNQHKAFNRHVIFYTNFQNVDGLPKGAIVRVDGMDAGELVNIQIPAGPGQKFRLKMNVEERLHGLIREDSLVTVETEGLVGDKFLLIHSGTERSPEAPPGSTLAGKEPFDLTKMLEQAQGLMNQAGTTITALQGTMKDVSGRLDTTLDTATGTLRNVDGVVRDVKSGKGTAGLLLEDKATATDVRQSIANVLQTTEKLNTTTTRADNLLADVQNRQLIPKMDDTLTSAKAATQNLNQTSGNLTDDTEALKHEFFFKGFFKHRGYDNLNDLPAEPYRAGQIFKSLPQNREWIDASGLFTKNENGEEVLSSDGRHNIDQAIGQFQEIYDKPL